MGLQLDGSGTLILSNTNSFYSGGTFLDSATLSISSDGNIGGSSSYIEFDGGTLATGTSLTSFGYHSVNWGSFDGGLSIPSGTTFSISAPISGSGGLTKLGLGTLILSGVDTYTGQTIVAAGILDVTGSLTSPVVVTGGTYEPGTPTVTPQLVANESNVTAYVGQQVSVTGYWQWPNGQTPSLSTSSSSALSGTVGWNVNSNGTWSWAYTPNVNDAPDQTVTITATYSTATAPVSFNLAVNPALCNLNTTATLSDYESTATVNGTFSDSIPNDTSSHTVTIDWGDETTAYTVTLNPGITSFTSPPHQYAASDDYTIQTTVTDSYGSSVEDDADASVYAIPQIGMCVDVPTASENQGTPAVILVGFTNEEAIDRPVTVNYQLQSSSTAAAGTDYQPLSGTVTIPAGQIEAPINITPLNANKAGGSLTVSIQTIADQTGASLCTPSTATVSINEDAAPEFDVVAHDTVGGGTPPANEIAAGYFTIECTNGYLDHSVVVHYSADGGNGSMYLPLSGTVVLYPYEMTQSGSMPPQWPEVIITPDHAEGSGGANNTATITLQSGPGYALSQGNTSGSVHYFDTYTNSSPPIPQIAVSDSGVSPGQNETFTVTVSGVDPTQGFSLSYYTTDGISNAWGIVNSAIAGQDYQGIPQTSPQTLSFSPGQTTATITVPTMLANLGGGWFWGFTLSVSGNVSYKDSYGDTLNRYLYSSGDGILLPVYGTATIRPDADGDGQIGPTDDFLNALSPAPIFVEGQGPRTMVQLNESIYELGGNSGASGSFHAELPNVPGLLFWASEEGGSPLTPDANGNVIYDSFSTQYSRTIWVSVDPNSVSASTDVASDTATDSTDAASPLADAPGTQTITIGIVGKKPGPEGTATARDKDVVMWDLHDQFTGLATDFAHLAENNTASNLVAKAGIAGKILALLTSNPLGTKGDFDVWTSDQINIPEYGGNGTIVEIKTAEQKKDTYFSTGTPAIPVFHCPAVSFQENFALQNLSVNGVAYIWVGANGKVMALDESNLKLQTSFSTSVTVGTTPKLGTVVNVISGFITGQNGGGLGASLTAKITGTINLGIGVNKNGTKEVDLSLAGNAQITWQVIVGAKQWGDVLCTKNFVVKGYLDPTEDIFGDWSLTWPDNAPKKK